MKDPAAGTAQLVSYVETNARNEFDVTCIAQVVDVAEGLEPTAVEWIVGIPHSELPMEPGRVWRVRVDRKNPKHLKLDESGEREAAEQAQESGRAEAERIAAAMREGKRS
jgi:hypothetical protein